MKRRKIFNETQARAFVSNNFKEQMGGIAIYIHEYSTYTANLPAMRKLSIVQDVKKKT